MVKLFIGILKGAILGAATGYGAHALHESTGFFNGWLTYGVVGALIGLFVGRPFWALIRDKNATTVVAGLKAAFGFGVGCGLYALVAKLWRPELHIAAYDGNLVAWPPVLGGLIGAVWGGFVELDDSIGDDKPEPKKKLTAAED
ncbi:MAG: hypothetical protein AB7P03_16345 [Kofleriaceae bacterium]